MFNFLITQLVKCVLSLFLCDLKGDPTYPV